MKASEVPEKIYVHKSQYWGLMANEHNITKDDIEYIRTDDFIEIFKAGAKWKEKQVIKDAIDATVFCESLKIPTIGQFLHKTNLKENDKVKVIIIKSE